MKDDLISRSELIAKLECFKLSLGDVILGFVVDRVIERVKAQPGVEMSAQPQTSPLRPSRNCKSCRFALRPSSEEPCRECIAIMGFTKWEATE